MDERFTIELLVANKYGVLNRVTALYAKRGYNIDSLYVHATEDATVSRMIITSHGDEYIRTQMVRQLSKLYDVKEIYMMSQVNI